MPVGGFNVQPIGGDRSPRSIGMPMGRHDEARQNAAYALAPRVPWDRFIERLDWNQGEHVGLIGPTGQGKTNLLMQLLPLRTYVAVFATKPRDTSMDRLIARGYQRFEEWPPGMPAARAPRRVVWPDATNLDALPNQTKVFRSAMMNIYSEGGWCTVIDEGFYTADMLGLKQEMKMFWTQGRALGISFTVATQRPAWVPREMYDGSSHLFFWRFSDFNDIRNIGGMGSAPSEAVRTLVQNLEQYQCLYVNTRTGEMMRTRAPAPR